MILQYTPWQFDYWCSFVSRGSKWHYGNFSFGFLVDRHPRFRNYILALGFIELGISWTREAVGSEDYGEDELDGFTYTVNR